MFTASEAVRAHLRWLAGRPGAAMSTLLGSELRSTLVAEALEREVLDADEVGAFEAVLDDLALQERVREGFVARDVYLSAVQTWWHLVGHRVEVRCP